jgi:hypothetical protein
MNPVGGSRIEPGEEAAHAARLLPFAVHQAPAHAVIAFRQMGEAVQQGSKVESGSSDDHRQTAASGNFANRISGDPSVLTSRVTVRRVQHVQQMVTYSAALRRRSFGGADVEAAIKLEGIAIDDLARKFLANAQRKRTFSGTRRAGDDNERVLGGGIHLLPSYPVGPREPIY